MARNGLTLIALAVLLVADAPTVAQPSCDPLPQSFYIVTASSEEDCNPTATDCHLGLAVQAIDGDPSTLWHSAWRDEDALEPHWLAIDLGGDYHLCGVRYTRRADDTDNGTPIDWAQTYSLNDGAIVASAGGTGDWPAAASPAHWIELDGVARHVKLRIDQGINDNGALAEMSVYAWATTGAGDPDPELNGFARFIWTPVQHPDLAGYRVYYRVEGESEWGVGAEYESPQVFTGCPWVTVEFQGRECHQGEISSLDPALTYEFHVKAYATDGRESEGPSPIRTGQPSVPEVPIPAVENLDLVPPGLW